MKRNEPVSKIMATNLLTVHHGAPVSKVRQLIREHGIEHVPVVSGQKLVGIISNSDVLRVSFGDAFQTDERAVDATLDDPMTIEQFMKSDPVAVRENAPIREAAETLVKGDFSLPPGGQRRPQTRGPRHLDRPHSLPARAVLIPCWSGSPRDRSAGRRPGCY